MFGVIYQVECFGSRMLIWTVFKVKFSCVETAFRSMCMRCVYVGRGRGGYMATKTKTHGYICSKSESLHEIQSYSNKNVFTRWWKSLLHHASCAGCNIRQSHVHAHKAVMSIIVISSSTLAPMHDSEWLGILLRKTCHFTKRLNL